MIGHSYFKSSYSLLESNINIDAMIKETIDHHQTHLALVDTDNLHGAAEFIFKCQKAHIKPLIGLELTLNIENYQGNILLYAHSQDGYYNLVKLSTLILNNQQKINLKLLENHSQGLSIVFPAYGSPLHSMFLLQKTQLVDLFIIKIRTFIQNIYFAINYNDGINNNNVFVNLAKKYQIKTILANKILFINKKKFLVPAALEAIKKQELLDLNDHRFIHNYFLSSGEIAKHINVEIIANTNHFLQTTAFSFNFKKTKMPKFKTPNNIDRQLYLTEICKKGLQKRYGDKLVPKHIERLKHELSVILKMDFADYFLIVWDFIKYAKEQKIIVGPGRGSAAGSLIAYVLGITNVDPFRYGLLFERFLNSERISMPDIDIDFQDDRREEVINYVFEKYGYDHIAYVTTFQTIGAKMAIRDVGRILNMPLASINVISKKIPFKLNIKLTEAFAESLAFKEVISRSSQNQLLFDVAKTIEGVPRQRGTHAAGIVFSYDNLTNIIPLVKSSFGIPQTQFSMHYLEYFGLLKMDFLGLKNLTTIDIIVKSIKNDLGIKIDLNKINLQDAKTFQLIKNVDTSGIFQLESLGMRNVLFQMQCNQFEDLVATIALYRPGPMKNIPQFIARKHGKEPIIYIDDSLKEILKPTYGIIVYQEQIMQIAIKVANFSNAKADILRQAMGKKEKKLMIKLEAEFISGAITNGYSQSKAQTIYQLIYQFADYGFNKSHSVAYALIGYQLAYLKANYPLQFIGALLSSVIGNEIKINEYIIDAKKLNIRVLGPSINKSSVQFAVEDNVIRYSLVSIKNIGQAAYKIIATDRLKNGLYKDFPSTIGRLIKCKINKKTLETFIWSGCFDEFGYSRTSLATILDDMIRYGESIYIEETASLFDEKLKLAPKITRKKDDLQLILLKEKELLGLYISNHPIIAEKKRINQKHGKIHDLCLLQNFLPHQKIAVIGVIEKLRKIITKKGDLMAFCEISDETSEVKATIFPFDFAKIENRIIIGETLVLIGFVENKERLQFIIKDCKNINEL